MDQCLSTGDINLNSSFGSTEQRKVHVKHSVCKFTFEKPPMEPPLPFGLFHEIQEVSVMRDFCSLCV